MYLFSVLVLLLLACIIGIYDVVHAVDKGPIRRGPHDFGPGHDDSHPHGPGHEGPEIEGSAYGPDGGPDHDYHHQGTHCIDGHHFRELIDLVNSDDKCIEIQNVFWYLDAINRNSGAHCRRHAIEVFTARFGNSGTPYYCRCNGGHIHLEAYHTGHRDGIEGDYRPQCLWHDHTYTEMYNSFFRTIHEHAEPSCRTHHSLWSTLNAITGKTDNENRDCQIDIISHLQYAYENHHEQCSCHYDHHATPTPKPTKPTVPPTTKPTTTKATTTRATTTRASTTKATTTKATTTKATTTKATTPYPMNNYHCDKYGTVFTIMQQHHAHNSNASTCTTMTPGSNEAFVLNTCNTSTPDVWYRGINVYGNCASIPHYTPIATFEGTEYRALGAQSGILVECLPNGFKMAVDHCNGQPGIEYITTEGMFTLNPKYYYVIV